jgi:hypothetical protein
MQKLAKHIFYILTRSFGMARKISVSLLNPNQMRYYGHKLCNDVTDQNRDFGISLPDHGMAIPFTMTGTTVYFESRVSSQWELKNCNIIVMTDDAWDSTTVTLAATSSTRGTRKEQVWRSISLIQAKPIQYPLTNDGILASISAAHDDVHFIKNMIASVNVATHVRTQPFLEDKKPGARQIAVIGAKNRHTHVSAEEVAKKLRCGIKTAKQTLKVTTQRGV